MKTHTKKRNYRKIYEQHYGPIQRDKNNRAMEIHHIDGNHENNDINNLKLVTIEEHYQIHYDQGDYNAAWLIAGKMTLTPEEQSDLARKANQERLEDGSHNFLNSDLQRKTALKRVEDGTHPFTDKKAQKERAIKRTAEGKNPFSGGEIQRKSNAKRLEEKTHNFLDSESQRQKALKRVKDGTHPFLGGDLQRKANAKMLAEGTHTSQFKWVCENCGKHGKGKGNFTRFHGDNCKHKKQ
jgi:hypothetical protein